MRKILLFCISVFLCTSTFTISAYDLSDSDYLVIDRIEDRLFDIIDQNDSITPDNIVGAIEKLMAKKKNDKKLVSILEVIVADMNIIYFGDEYGGINDFSFEMLPEDCFEDEKYDFEEKICYLDEVDDVDMSDYVDYDFHDEGHHDFKMTEDDCFEGEEYDSELELCYLPNHTDFPQFGSEFFDDDNTQVNNRPVMYNIKGDNIVLQRGEQMLEHKEIWDLFISLIPKSFRTDLIQYGVTNTPGSDDYAYVQQNSSNNDKWNMVVNMGVFYGEDGKLNIEESIHTLIHEFAHILTLNKTQVQYIPADLESDLMFQRFQGNCKTNFIQEGCLYKKSYLDKYINIFWKEDFKKIKNNTGKGNSLDFYTGKETHYVTEYASTNPGEDIAETFTIFILKERPMGNTIADKKLKFLYEYPELVQLRTLIRSRLNQLK